MTSASGPVVGAGEFCLLPSPATGAVTGAGHQRDHCHWHRQAWLREPFSFSSASALRRHWRAVHCRPHRLLLSVCPASLSKSATSERKIHLKRCIRNDPTPGGLLRRSRLAEQASGIATGQYRSLTTSDRPTRLIGFFSWFSPVRRRQHRALATSDNLDSQCWINDVYNGRCIADSHGQAESSGGLDSRPFDVSGEFPRFPFSRRA